MRWELLPLLLLLGKPSASETIPTLHAQSFADARVNLPADLNGKIGILVVGFSKKSSLQTRQWNESLLTDYGNDAQVAYYQAPVLADVPALIRGIVLKGIQNQLSLAERAHFVPILQQASKWKEVTHFTSSDDAYLLVVGSTGQIEWRSHGPKTEQTYRALQERLAELRQSTPNKTQHRP